MRIPIEEGKVLLTKDQYAQFGLSPIAQDIYIFVMAHIPGIGDRARALGYDPYNPTRDSLARVKKEMKRERSICKTVVLACIEEGTPIRVRGKGLIPIQEISDGDEVWDGINWVTTTGAIDKGIRLCKYMEAVGLTPDHLILDSEGNWNEAQYYDGQIREGRQAVELYRPEKPSASWSEVWKVVCSLFSWKTYK